MHVPGGKSSHVEPHGAGGIPRRGQVLKSLSKVRTLII